MPVVRLALMVAAILWIVPIVPIVVSVMLQRFPLIEGAASIANGFAFKDHVSSLIAGLLAMVDHSYRAGNWVQVGDDHGELQHVGLKSLSLRTATDNKVVVPHLRLWSDNVANGNDDARDR